MSTCLSESISAPERIGSFLKAGSQSPSADWRELNHLREVLQRRLITQVDGLSCELSTTEGGHPVLRLADGRARGVERFIEVTRDRDQDGFWIVGQRRMAVGASHTSLLVTIADEVLRLRRECGGKADETAVIRSARRALLQGIADMSAGHPERHLLSAMLLERVRHKTAAV